MNSRVTRTIRLPGWAEVHFTPIEAVLVKLLLDSAFTGGTMKLRCREQGIKLARFRLNDGGVWFFEGIIS